MITRKIWICLIISAILAGCGHYSGNNLNPDDAFSESVKEKFGDSFRYNDH